MDSDDAVQRSLIASKLRRHFCPVDYESVPRVNSNKAKAGKPSLRNDEGKECKKWRPENNEYRLLQETIVPPLPDVMTWDSAKRSEAPEPRHIAINDAKAISTVADSSFLSVSPSPGLNEEIDILLDVPLSADTPRPKALDVENESAEIIDVSSPFSLMMKRDSGNRQSPARRPQSNRVKKAKKVAPIQSSKITKFFGKSS